MPLRSRLQHLAAMVLDVLFGCRHSRMTSPLTLPPGKTRCEAASITGTYIVCLDCGKEFPYDWSTMSIVPRARTSVPEPLRDNA